MAGQNNFFIRVFILMQTLNISDRLSLLIRDARVRAIFLSSALIVALSFYRGYIAGTIRVDGHGLSGVPVLIVFTGFLIGLVVYSIIFYRLWDRGDLDINAIRLLAFILAAVFSLMLPMLSNDIFSLLTYGDAANRGADVYADVKSLPVSPFFDYVSSNWKTAPCVYGPVSLGTSRIAAAISGGNIFLAIAAYKAIAFIWSVVFIEMAYRTSIFLKASVKPFLFIVLNPVFLIQGVAQLHCDMLALALCCSMLFFFFSGKWHLAFLFAGLAILAKMNFILVLGFLVVALFIGKKSWPSFFYKTVAGMGITFAIIFLFYYPYYTSINTFKIPFNFLFGQNPAKSVPEVMGDIVYFGSMLLSGHTEELRTAVHSTSGLFPGQMAAWLGIKLIFQVLSLLLTAYIFIKFWFGPRDSKKWMGIFLRLLLIFLLFYSHVFYAWYLMVLLPFVWFEEDKRFMQWLFVLTCFSNVHDIMCSVNHGTPVYFVVLPLTFLSVLVFFWRFRNNFFTSLKSDFPVS
jgi:hypothetical protein